MTFSTIKTMGDYVRKFVSWITELEGSIRLGLNVDGIVIPCSSFLLLFIFL